MRLNIDIAFIETPVTITFRHEEGLWWATALQFNLLGSGKTKDAALEEVRELTNEYLEAALELDGKARLINFCEEEADNPDRHDYTVVAAMARPAREKPAPRVIPLKDIMRYRDRVRSLDLAPACATV